MKLTRWLFVVVLFVVTSLAAQEKKYISYTVKQGETLKSIAKELGVKPKELMKLNPDVSKRPAANTVIIVPNKNFGKTTVVKAEGQRTHMVARKESLFSIAQKYGVSVDALKAVNDLTGNAISVGRVLIIPEKVDPIVEEEKTPVIDSTHITHLVVKDDTVFNLTKRYDISEDALYELNPHLKDGLNLGMTLIVGIKSSEEESTIVYFNDSITDRTLNVVLMLPYKFNNIDLEPKESEEEDGEPIPFEWDNRLLNIVTDFHAGAEVAIDSLRMQGLDINVSVLDTENSNQKLQALVRADEVKDADVIIGPLFLKNAKFVSDRVNVPVVAPLYSKSQTQVSDKNLVKVAPNKSLLEERVVEYMLDNYNGEKIIISGDAKPATTTKINQLIAKFKTHDSINDITILQPEEGYIKKERFIEVIDTLELKNWVLLLGDDNIVTADVVNNLGVMPLEKRDIQLFSFGKGKSFDNVNNDHLARLNFTYPQVSFKDVTRVETRSFEKLYKEKNYVRPNQFAATGFDVTYDTLLRLASGKQIENTAEGVSRRVATMFAYDKRLFGSVENNGIFLLQYQDNLDLISIE